MSDKNKNINVTIKMNFSGDMSKEQIRNTISDAIDTFYEKAHDNNSKSVDEKKSSFLKRLLKVLSLPFISKKKVNGNEATMTLLSTGISVIFGVVAVVLFLIGIIGMIGYPIIFVGFMKNVSTPFYICISVAIGFLSYMVSGVFRMASIEIEKMENSDSIINLFAAVMALIAVVVALIVGKV